MIKRPMVNIQRSTLNTIPLKLLRFLSFWTYVIFIINTIAACFYTIYVLMILTEISKQKGLFGISLGLGSIFCLIMYLCILFEYAGYRLITSVITLTEYLKGRELNQNKVNSIILNNINNKW